MSADASLLKLIPGGIAADDRGLLKFINEFDPQTFGIRRMFQVEDFRPGTVRAWHGHWNEDRYVFVTRGAALIGAVPMRDPAPNEHFQPLTSVLAAEKPGILFIPRGSYYGMMGLVEETSVLIFTTATLEQSKSDDLRLPYDRWNIWQVRNR